MEWYYAVILKIIILLFFNPILIIIMNFYLIFKGYGIGNFFTSLIFIRFINPNNEKPNENIDGNFYFI